MAKDASFGKPEKLKSRKLVEELFATGKSQNVFPIRISYKFFPLPENEKALVQAGFSVSKRNFKRAVDRNRIKRLLREAYRLQKKELLQELAARKIKGIVFFIYTDKELPTYQQVFIAITKCVFVLKKKANENPS